MAKPKLTDEQMKLRLEVRQIARRVYATSGATIRSLGADGSVARMTVWKQVMADDDETLSIPLDVVLAWLREPDSREFARRLLGELIAQFDVEQLRLVDLYRYADSPHQSQNQTAVTVVKNLAERFGLIPANHTNTLEVTTNVAK
jgi:hypothetical protein